MRRLCTTWCAGCQSNVPDRSWNQDTYLCTDCTANVLHLIRLWAGGKVLDAFPIATVIRTRVEA
ncbi:hypothetical protein [Micromonospora sp. KC721]|uniref:hypothetical protein n=1 Tax=Micromonospora sp. KC721 TaxID=2530380 RepID=UPI001052613D|nr:hypothetical protein [Micromonospora sp. KC721]TDB69355.1 hypothetical protein E1182_30235 [Micromonospora sp. KC721]